MTQNFKELTIPVGWNALLNHNDKIALFIGENKSTKSSARTVLELLSKPNEAELRSAIQALGYEIKELKKPIRQ